MAYISLDQGSLFLYKCKITNSSITFPMEHMIALLTFINLMSFNGCHKSSDNCNYDCLLCRFQRCWRQRTLCSQKAPRHYVIVAGTLWPTCENGE